eukprot:c16051_g1_i2.p1 GENE.c16051_g1_i2~~c16051_g1_i2.p1  ORF type:complete len:144 (-),score=39.13 c16051_g1_i2:19-450(-)
MNKRFHIGEIPKAQEEYYKMFEDWVREMGLIDDEEDIDVAIEDLWREKIEKQEQDYLEYQNYEVLRSDLHDLLRKYPHGSDLSKMDRMDQARLEHLVFQYDRLQKEADNLRQMKRTESGMFEDRIEHEEVVKQLKNMKKRKDL